MLFTARDVIRMTKYGELMDAATTLRLAEAEAKLVGNNIDNAMRACAGIVARRIELKDLKYKLLEMVIADYPGNILIALEKQIDKMVNVFEEQSGVMIEADSEETLRSMVSKKSKPMIPYMVINND